MQNIADYLKTAIGSFAVPGQVVASLVYDKMEISTEDPNTPLLRHVFFGWSWQMDQTPGKNLA